MFEHMNCGVSIIRSGRLHSNRPLCQCTRACIDGSGLQYALVHLVVVLDGAQCFVATSKCTVSVTHS